MSIDPPSPVLPGLERPLPADVVRTIEIGIEAGTAPPIEVLRQLVAAHRLDYVPLPGHGRTARRFGLLAQVSDADLPLGRLVEGHLDALAILAEAGRPARPGSYGVWAAERPGGALRAREAGDGHGRWVISGTKPYASGAGALDRALVTATTAEGPRLFDVDLGLGASSEGCDVLSVVADSWPAVGMADSLSGAVRFGDVRVDEAAAIGPPGFYTARPGFWAGSAGVAACWYGGADGVLRALTATLHRADPASAAPGPHVLAHLGAAAVRCRSLAAALTAAAAEIDRDPDDRTGSARLRALSLRHLVYEGCGEVLDRASRAGRTSLLTSDGAAARRLADLPVYLSQHHPDDALVAIGLDVLEGRSGPCVRSDG